MPGYSKILRFLLFIFLCGNQCLAQENEFKAPSRGFVSWQPAQTWEHALLSGNGTMGAMVMGQPHQETIILTESNLFLPLNSPKPPIHQASRLTEIRKLLLEGKNEEASRIPVEQRNKEGFDIGRDPFIPAFDLNIEQEPANIKRYQRSVDFETGETKTSWNDDLGFFERRLFVSRADGIIVLSIKGTAKINCTLNFDKRPVEWNQWQFVNSGIKEMSSSAEEGWLTYHCNFKNHFSGGLQGFEGVGKVILNGGSSRVVNNRLQVTNANEVLLLIKIKPSSNISASEIANIKSQLSSVTDSYDELKSKHKKIHGQLFNQSRLSLNGAVTDQNLFTEELLQKAKKQVPHGLIEKVFDAGRYNIISAMGANPPNLQGIWSGTWTAPWSADYTHDGNVQSAIASVLSSNMPALMEAYFGYLEKLMPVFKENARLLYGTKGIHIPAHTSTTGLDTDFSETWCLTYWTGAAGWASSFFFDYYQYTENKEFLRKRAYPFMKDAVLFYEDFLITGTDGRYIFNPSYSPENNPANGKSQAAINATMDVMIAKQLLKNCIQAAKILNTDATKIKKWKSMLDKMPAYQVAPDGTLREWLWPGMEENHSHRHASQLYALYNESDRDIINDSSLLKAVNRTLEEKLKYRQSEGGGEMAFGLVQLGLTAAHIGEAQKAKQVVDWLSSKYWSAGMGSFHNVGGLFNTDISGGLPAVIIEMLIYADADQISIFPALPEEWPKGKLEGVLLRGNIQMKNLEWNEKEGSMVLQAASNKKVNLKLPKTVRSISVNGVIVNKDLLQDHYQLSLAKGQDTELKFILNH